MSCPCPPKAKGAGPVKGRVRSQRDERERCGPCRLFFCLLLRGNGRAKPWKKNRGMLDAASYPPVFCAVGEAFPSCAQADAKALPEGFARSLRRGVCARFAQRATITSASSTGMTVRNVSRLVSICRPIFPALKSMASKSCAVSCATVRNGFFMPMGEQPPCT